MTCFSRCFGQNDSFPSRQEEDVDEDTEFSIIQNAKVYHFKELEMATEKFSLANKIGEGGFGSVYKGRLRDGTLAAIKVLSAKSEQGAREFLNEIVAISGVEHENLVKLYGCCTEGEHRMLVYGYLENNSLARTLLSGRYNTAQFTWQTRTKICIGVARGLAFLHDEIQPHIVHRDIKASNILLDKDLTPKISDFGLAKLFPATATHVSTRVAGTLGYLAPEYAVRGKLTRKADVYSFGVLLMEIVTGKPNTNRRLPHGQRNLLERAWTLYEKGELVELVDDALEGDFSSDEVCRYLKVSLICTQDLPKNRPMMSEVLKMLNGEMDLYEEISKPGLLRDLTAIRLSHPSSSESKPPDKSSESTTTLNTYATMSFPSIYDRSS